jgi:hypothetical protein
MELNKIEIVVKKYFDGETSVEEEKELRKYFASTDVAAHIMQYKSIFGYFSYAASQESKQELAALPKLQYKKRSKLWFPIAASVFVLLSVGMYVYVDRDVSQQDLGTCDNPEEAMKETQRALAILSGHVNVGIESVMSLEQYEDSKKLIFKQ